MRQLEAICVRQRSVIVSTPVDEDDRRLGRLALHPPRTQRDRLVGRPKLDRFKGAAVVPWGLDEGEPIRSGSKKRWGDENERGYRDDRRGRADDYDTLRRHVLDSLGLPYGQPALHVAGVHGGRGLKQDDVDLLLCNGPMLAAARDDDELPLLDGYAPIPKLHREPALLDQKEFVLVLVPVPDERALELDELHVVSVHLPDDLRVPMGREQGELLRQVDLIHASSARPLVRATAGSRSLPF